LGRDVAATSADGDLEVALAYKSIIAGHGFQDLAGKIALKKEAAYSCFGRLTGETCYSLRLFAVTLQSEGNPKGEVRHSLLTWRIAKLSLN
jgi:hypothetical protein